MPFKKYIPIKQEVSAQSIKSLTVTTVATLEDDTTIQVDNSAAVGDFVELNADQTTTLVAQADFLAQFVEAPAA
ncbi:MAG: hypothetical protein WCL60_01270 [Methylococcales bacterium]